MNQNQKYRVSGALFENERQTGPLYSGFIEIDGVKTQISVWPRTANSGKNFLSISEEKPRVPQQGAPQVRSPQVQTRSPFPGKPRNEDMDDDVPF